MVRPFFVFLLLAIPSLAGWDDIPKIAEADLEIQTKCVLGQGCCGPVYLGTFRGINVAVKTYNISSEDTQSQFENEANLLWELRGQPGVIELIGIVTNNSIVLEICDRSLGQRLLDKNKPRLKEVKLLWILAQSAQSLLNLHRHSITHRDIKPDNILIQKNGKNTVVKWCDFQLARRLDAPSILTKSAAQMLTACYASPEVIECGKRSESADVFSFAITMWEAATGQKAFANLDLPISVLYAIARGRRPDIDTVTHPALRELIAACWAAASELRPTMAIVHAKLLEMQNPTTP